MVIIQNLQDGLGYFSFICIVRVKPYLHLGLADGHESNSES